MTRRATVSRKRTAIASLLGGSFAVAVACQLPAASRQATAVRPDSLFRVQSRRFGVVEFPGTVLANRTGVSPGQGQDTIRFYSDSEAAARLQPGCSSGPTTSDSATIKLLLTDVAAGPGGRIRVSSVPAASPGLRLDYKNPRSGVTGLTCSMRSAGQIRLFGRGAFAGATIVVQASVPTMLVVTTGSGRVLAGPVAIERGSQAYDMSWSAIRR